MGIAFNDSHGSAKKTSLDYIKLVEGENIIRLVGPIRARYAYWKQLKTNSIPVECLSFDPDKEEFTNIEKDYYKEYFPEDRCVWSYVGTGIDAKDEKLKLVGLKKKLWAQVVDAAKELGDPTDPETGWPLIFDKVKTGPHSFNIEYRLNAIKCQKAKGPLTDGEKEMIEENLKPIDDLVPRPTAEDQKAFILNNWINVEEKNTDAEAISELSDDKEDEDDPF